MKLYTFYKRQPRFHYRQTCDIIQRHRRHSTHNTNAKTHTSPKTAPKIKEAQFNDLSPQIITLSIIKVTLHLGFFFEIAVFAEKISKNTKSSDRFTKASIRSSENSCTSSPTLKIQPLNVKHTFPYFFLKPFTLTVCFCFKF